MFTPRFHQRLAWMRATLPDDFTAVFFGGCLNLHAAQDMKKEAVADLVSASASPSFECQTVTASGLLVDCSTPSGRLTSLLIPTTRSRCASGYSVSRASAARVLSVLRQVTRNQTKFSPIDHTYNTVFERMLQDSGAAQSSVYQLEPPSSYESSKLLTPYAPATPPSLRIVDRQPLPTVLSSPPLTPLPPVLQPPPPSAGLLQLPSPASPQSVCDVLCGWQRPFSSASISRAQSRTGADWSAYLSPTAFRDMTDWAYWRHDEVLPANDRLRAINDSAAVVCLPAGALIYVQTTMIIKFFQEVHPQLQRPYFLLTGSADQMTPDEWLHYLDDRTEDGSSRKLLHWFGQNGNSSHPHFTAIPIGLNYHEMADALDQSLRGAGSLVEAPTPHPLDDGTLDLAEGETAEVGRYRQRIAAFRWANVGDFDEQHSLLVNFALGSNAKERGPPLLFACGNDTAGGGG